MPPVTQAFTRTTPSSSRPHNPDLPEGLPTTQQVREHVAQLKAAEAAAAAAKAEEARRAAEAAANKPKRYSTQRTAGVKGPHDEMLAVSASATVPVIQHPAGQIPVAAGVDQHQYSALPPRLQRNKYYGMFRLLLNIYWSLCLIDTKISRRL